MQSRRDQAQAQSYLLGRLTAALVTGELDSLETPHKRAVNGLIAGVLVSALVAGGFALYGLFVPGGSSRWRQPGTLVVEKETGSRYLYLGGRLRPVLNYTSAQLLLGGQMTVASVSARSLGGVAHGQPIGIVGAPDTLPATGLTGTWWTACAPTTTDPAGTHRTALILHIATMPSGTPMRIDRAVPVQADDHTYLIWNGHRYRMAEPWVAKVLGYGGAAAVVPAAWLDLIPAGPDLGTMDMPGRGAAGPAVDGRPTRVGQLFTAGSDRQYLLRADGLARLTPTAYALLAGDPATVTAYPDGVVTATAISPAAIAGLPVSSATPSSGLPDAPPPTATAAGLAWCLQSAPDGGTRIVADRVASGSGVVRGGVGLTRTARTADAVTVDPGLGGLVVEGRPDAARGSASYLVTDSGTRYPVASGSVAKELGYEPAAAAVVSPDLLDLLPTGPLLDPARVVG